MHRFVVFSALFMLSLTAATASAQRVTTIGQVCPYDLKFSNSGKQDDADATYLFRDLRGGIGVFFFFRSSNLLSVEKLEGLRPLAEQYRNRGVRFISVTADNDAKWTEFSRNHEINFYSAHYWSATILYYILGAASDPYVVLVDPRGRLAWRGVPDHLLGERIADLIEYTKPPLGDEAWQARRLGKAEQWYSQREYGKAFTIARDLFKMAEAGSALNGRAEALMSRCQTAAAEWLREAIQIEQAGDLDQAARIVAEIAVRFEDPDAEEGDNRDRRDRRTEGDPYYQAALEIGRMNGDRRMKSKIRDARNNARGELLNDQAAAFEEDEYYRDAGELYEQVVAECEDTNAAKHAKSRLRTFKRDKEIQKKIADARALEQAWRWLDVGDHFLTLGMPAQAKKQFGELVEKHPGTRPAERAEDRLLEMKAD